ncbi:MAG: helix-turn-helix transcriptional regulator [Clostridiales bacterium]|nr:helix-turn-helix transcriptional regulator [Clostridiales bacterium]
MFGDKLKKYRTDKGLSQNDLAEKLFVTRQCVSKWEKGITQPDLETLAQISELLDIPVDALIKDDGKSSGDNYADGAGLSFTVNLSSANVKRAFDLLISIVFVGFGVICCFMMTYLSLEINNAWDIIWKIVGTFFFALVALAILFINVVLFLKKSDSRRGYYLAAGFSIGAGVAVECCALLQYIVAALFFWPFAAGPIIVFVVHTSVWANVGRRHAKERIVAISDKTSVPFILAYALSVGVCIALIVYFISAGWVFYALLLLPLAIVTPVLALAIFGFTKATVKNEQNPFMQLTVGLCIGLSWIFEHQKFMYFVVFDLRVSFVIFAVALVGLSVWLVFDVVGCISRLVANRKSTAVAHVDEDRSDG